LKRKTPQFACNWNLALKQEAQYLRRVRLQQAEVQVRGREQNVPRIFWRSSRGRSDAGGYSHKTGGLGPRLQWRLGRNARRFWREYIAKMKNQKD
jgi:hypothetical protein